MNTNPKTTRPFSLPRLCVTAKLRPLLLIAVFPFVAAGEPGPAAEEATWIWSGEAAEGNPSAPVGEAFFRSVFEISGGAGIREAVMDVGADNFAEVFVNGKPAGKFAGWNPLERSDVGALLRPGKNVLAVRAENKSPGPAGLLLRLKVVREGAEPPLRIGTGSSWEASSREVANWKTSKGAIKEFEPANVVAKNGDAPWGLCLPPASGTKTFPQFSAEGEDLSGLNDMLARFHPACNMDVAGTYALAWLPRAMLWVGDASQAGESVTRARIANRIGRMHMSADGYVSCHQHEGLAHSEGWPFPLPSQSGGVGFFFSIAGLLYGKEFQVFPVKDVDGWNLEHAKTVALDAEKGWAVELTAPGATVTSPEFAAGAMVSPFIRVKWNTSELPADSKPYLEWTTKTEPDFAATRRMEFPKPSSSSKFPVLDFDIPIHEITKAQGRLTRLRIGFGNPAAGKVILLRVFTAVDSRHTINNPNYLIASADYFDWTGDRAWLAANLEKMRSAAAYMISEFQVRDAHLLRTPWIGHDGRSGLEYTAAGKKIVHKGVGIGGNYWDLLPFGGDDALATIYLYSALERMAQIEEFVAAEKLMPDTNPAAGLDAQSLRELAEAVRKKFQETFWNPKTRRFAPKDDQGRFRDFGFTFLNNEAIFYGLAIREQAEDILSWQSGGRTVDGDTSQGEDIYKFRFGPRSTTRRNIDYYAYVWWRPENLQFGDQVQDGGAVLGFTYHDLMARIRYLGADNAWKRLREILTWYKDVKEAGGARAYYAVPGRGTLQGGGTAGGLGIDEEFYESVLAPAIILDGFIGFSVRSDGFDLNPALPGGIGKLAVTNVAYRDLLWDIDLIPGTVTFRVRSGMVDSPLRVRLPAGKWTIKILAKERGAQKGIEIPSGPQGFELPAGPLHQLTIIKNPAD